MPMPEEANAGLPDGTRDARAMFPLFREYVAGAEARTGIRFGWPPGEARFCALWQRLSEADRAWLRQVFAEGFQARADASWPRTAAVLDRLRSAGQLGRVAESLRRVLYA
jgi:hypothetical protein